MLPARGIDLSRNRLLGALPEKERQLLSPNWHLIHLPRGELIYEHGDILRYLYFPLDCVISTVAIMDDGATVEVAMTGREGLFGVEAVFDLHTAQYWTEAMVQGNAIRIESKALRDKIETSSHLSAILMNYYCSLINHLSVRAVCHTRHSVLQRLCCWLLMVHDRTGSAELPLTQEIIARKLGSRRAGITEAARSLQKRGAIRSCRGHIYLRNLKLIETAACECYQAQKKNDRPASA
jgi:CRP-like cAMP-binding protein